MPSVLPTSDLEKFACLKDAERLWVIGAVHGNLKGLKAIHHGILTHVRGGDKFIYLGNYYGGGSDNIKTINELLLTRREIMSMPAVFMPDDFVYLRGAKEEMFSKLLQIQFAPNPVEVMAWLLDHGMGDIIAAYGTSAREALNVSSQGTVALTRWTGAIRRSIYSHLGHNDLIKNLRRAAFTETGELLFVHSSVDVTRPMTMQKDNFWWDNGTFDHIDAAYSGFKKIVRGYAHVSPKLDVDKPFHMTVDGGSGRGGLLQALCLSPTGEILRHLSE